MRFESYSRRAEQVQATQYDGSLDLSDSLIRMSRGGQEIYFEDDGFRLVLTGPEGTFDILEGFWVVLHSDGKIEVFDEEQFNELYEKR